MKKNATYSCFDVKISLGHSLRDTVYKWKFWISPSACRPRRTFRDRELNIRVTYFYSFENLWNHAICVHLLHATVAPKLYRVDAALLFEFYLKVKKFKTNIFGKLRIQAVLNWKIFSSENLKNNDYKKKLYMRYHYYIWYMVTSRYRIKIVEK